MCNPGDTPTATTLVVILIPGATATGGLASQRLTPSAYHIFRDNTTLLHPKACNFI